LSTGSEGIVEDVFIFGAPVTSDPKSWAKFERVVAGRIINGYCRHVIAFFLLFLWFFFF
jgi:hypothetical protein